jgi:centrosomal protein CEP135
MTDKSSAQAQQKFTNLRKRLDQLGYRQTLGLESLPLVEKLFADLVHTTFAYLINFGFFWGHF